ncbi:hypothetical protein [Nitrospira sp. BLG_2]|uniref:hypothetical protein n=1 Tax=Nitrospira sp. BLG_2 TaxID=3397507 RepID=UPI003B9C1153
MIQRRKTACIAAIVPFAMATVSFSVSANATSGTEGHDASTMKREQDGSVSKKEFMKHHEWMFDQEDKNKNGSLDTEEMRNLHKRVSTMHERFEQKFPEHSTPAKPN